MKEAYAEVKQKVDEGLVFQQEFMSMRDIFMIGQINTSQAWVPYLWRECQHQCKPFNYALNIYKAKYNRVASIRLLIVE